MYNMQLWETSGHAANYKDNMFVFEVRFVLCCAAMILIINLSYLCFIMKETKYGGSKIVKQKLVGSIEY